MVRPKRGQPGDAEATAKLKRTLLEKYGSQEAYHKKMQEIGRKGGSRKGRKGFALDHERAKRAGAKGGAISHRYGSPQIDKMDREMDKILEMLREGHTKREIAEWLDVGYASFLNWAKRNIKMEVLYKDEVDEKEND